MVKIEKLKLVHRSNPENDTQYVSEFYFVEAEEIDKTMKALLKSIEKLEDKVFELEYRMKNHINTIEDIAHKI